MYKLIISDFDGTLIKKDGSISNQQLEKINSFIARGGIFIVSTGRMTTSILPLVRKIGLKGYVSSFNGGELTDIETGKTIFSNKIPNELAIKVYKVLEECGAYAHGYHSGEYFAEKRTKVTDLYERLTFVKATVLNKKLSEHFTENKLDTNKILVMDESDVIDKTITKLEQFKDRLHIVRSNAVQIEITDLSSTKGESLKKISKILNVPINEIIAVGDGGNDVPMLQTAGLGIAVANSEEYVKPHADVVYRYSNEQDAIMHIIEEYT